MLRRLREIGPGLLVPLAWTFAAAAHVEFANVETVRIGMFVMDALLVAFTVLSWSDMREGVLFAWKVVLVVGIGLNLVGTVAVLDPVDPTLARVSVAGWMLVPAAAYVYTGANVEHTPWVYTGGAALGAVGALAYLLAPAVSADVLALLGFALVAVGQTAGILVAVRSSRHASAEPTHESPPDPETGT